MRVRLLWVALLLGLTAWADGDRDGDGLSDFHEQHKYMTNPDVTDSDGDGTPDSHWRERREYSYSLRTVVRVMKPCNLDSINDDYQDVKVLQKHRDYVELEVIHYPLNTVRQSLTGTVNWRSPPPALQAYLRPRVTTNWDSAMRKDMLVALAADDIVPEQLDDATLARKLSRWLMKRGKHRYMFSTYFLHFPNGQAAIYPGLEDAFASEKGNTQIPFAEHLQHEVFGKGMYDNRSYGTCTSTAVYLTTGFRAVGLPCRMIVTIPIVDPTDDAQIDMVRNNLKNHAIRAHLLKAFDDLSGFIAHTFNEVYIDGRWRRLNYSDLGADIDDIFGMLTHVHTFADLSEAGLTETWGKRYGLGERDEQFPFDNPYRCLELSDQFGTHCKLENPMVEASPSP